MSSVHPSYMHLVLLSILLVHNLVARLYWVPRYRVLKGGVRTGELGYNKNQTNSFTTHMRADFPFKGHY